VARRGGHQLDEEKGHTFEEERVDTETIANDVGVSTEEEKQQIGHWTVVG